MTTERFVGIDLGTTFSSLCYLDDNLAPQALVNRHGESIMPSAVFFLEQGAGVLVGRDAVTHGFRRPDRFVNASKRRLGQEDVAWEIDGVDYTPVDIAAFIIRQLLVDAAEKIGPVRQAVVTVPAHFTGRQRELTIQAAKQAGLERADIVNEPVAAALEYALGKTGLTMTYLHENATVLVFDLGGGTFDLSLVRYDDTQLRVLATSGERKLGGLDWDQCLVDFVSERFRQIHGDDVRAHRGSLRKLAHEVELAKCHLSGQRASKATVRVEHDGNDAEFEIDRAFFEQLTSHLVQRTQVLTERLVESQGIPWSDIHVLVPVGGPTHMPMIARLLAEFESRGPSLHFRSPELAVARGAALFAGMVHGDAERLGDGAMAAVLGRYRTRNVTANNLGIVLKNNAGRYFNHVLIKRDTPLPASATVRVETVRPNQRQVRVRIVEGDAGELEVGREVCTCVLDQLPANLPARSRFEVNLIYDADGLLQAMVHHPDSGRSGTATILHS